MNHIRKEEQVILLSIFYGIDSGMSRNCIGKKLFYPVMPVTRNALSPGVYVEKKHGDFLVNYDFRCILIKYKTP